MLEKIFIFVMYWLITGVLAIAQLIVKIDLVISWYNNAHIYRENETMHDVEKRMIPIYAFEMSIIYGLYIILIIWLIN